MKDRGEKIATYRAWAKRWGEENEVRAQCMAATEAMVEQFPELRVVRGFAESMVDGTVEHRWCEDEEGWVYDPTVRQFIGTVIYREFEPGDWVRAGKCMNCGTTIYASPPSAQELCNKGYRNHLVGGATSTISCSAGCERELEEAFDGM